MVNRWCRKDDSSAHENVKLYNASLTFKNKTYSSCVQMLILTCDFFRLSVSHFWKVYYKIMRVWRFSKYFNFSPRIPTTQSVPYLSIYLKITYNISCKILNGTYPSRKLYQSWQFDVNESWGLVYVIATYGRIYWTS